MTRAALAVTLALALPTACGTAERAAAPAPERPRTDPSGLPTVIPGRGSVVAHATRATWLRAAPGGRRLVHIKAKTEFGSARVLSVVGRRGPWMAVLVPELPNGRTGWLDARRHTRLFRVPYTLEARLTQRRVIVRRLGRVVSSFPVAIGRPVAPTPRGRFAVTDKLLTGNAGGAYGCCVLALTGHQPKVPQGWGGGDRLALHATPAFETIGQEASLGCLRAATPVMRRLVRQIAIGTPVRVT
jgi:lipoprotein-anchoring transpeptidase ErfK/SrfK